MKPPFIITEDFMLSDLSDIGEMYIDTSLDNPEDDSCFVSHVELFITRKYKDGEPATLCSLSFRHNLELTDHVKNELELAELRSLNRIAQELSSPQRLVYTSDDFIELIKFFKAAFDIIGAELVQEED